MPRESVVWFSERMEERLLANDHKGGWGTCSAFFLLGRLIEEVKELEEVLQSFMGPPMGSSGEDMRLLCNKVLGEAADVANFAMMIADNSKEEKPVPKPKGYGLKIYPRLREEN